MTTLSHLNYLAVLVSTLAYFILGALWYSPVLFSKPWMAGHGISMPDNDEAKAKMKKQMPMMMLMTFVVCFIASVAIGWLEAVIGATNCVLGLKIGVVASVFPCVAIALSHMYTQKSFKLTVIDAGYHVAGVIAAAVILSVWR
jgi:hypothetical protein